MFSYIEMHLQTIFCESLKNFFARYALACIAYELFTGQRPFDTNNDVIAMFKHLNDEPPPPNQINPDVPEHISQAIGKRTRRPFP